MSYKITKLASAGLLCASLIGASFTTATPAQAQRVLGALIFGAVAGGLVAGAVRRCHGHGAGHHHCHGHHGGHNHYQTGVVYVQPAPVYIQPAPVVIAPPVYSGGGFPAQHYQWCQRKFRSYHLASNSYQPYNGPRRACRSPWG